MNKVDELDLAVKMIYNQLKREKVDPRVSLIFEEFNLFFFICRKSLQLI